MDLLQRRVIAAQFTHVADEIGDARAGNMVMLGSLLQATGVLPQVSVDAALRRLVKHKKWVELDERALERGRAVYDALQQEVCSAV